MPIKLTLLQRTLQGTRRVVRPPPLSRSRTAPSPRRKPLIERLLPPPASTSLRSVSASAPALDPSRERRRTVGTFRAWLLPLSAVPSPRTAARVGLYAFSWGDAAALCPGGHRSSVRPLPRTDAGPSPPFGRWD